MSLTYKHVWGCRFLRTGLEHGDNLRGRPMYPIIRVGHTSALTT